MVYPTTGLRLVIELEDVDHVYNRYSECLFTELRTTSLTKVDHIEDSSLAAF